MVKVGEWGGGVEGKRGGGEDKGERRERKRRRKVERRRGKKRRSGGWLVLRRNELHCVDMSRASLKGPQPPLQALSITSPGSHREVKLAPTKGPFPV